MENGFSESWERGAPIRSFVSRQAGPNPLMKIKATNAARQPTLLEVQFVHTSRQMLRSIQFILKERPVYDQLGCCARELLGLPRLDLSAHRLEIPLHAIDANRDNIADPHFRCTARPVWRRCSFNAQYSNRNVNASIRFGSVALGVPATAGFETTPVAGLNWIAEFNPLYSV